MEPALRRLVEAGRAAWPDIALDVDAYARHLRRHLGTAPPEGARLNLGDLYLACACFHGDRAALEIFDGEVLSHVPTFLARIDASPAFADEVRQLLRRKLLVSDGAEPKIAAYAGRGSLKSWVRAAAVRTALNLRRDERHNRPLEEREAELLGGSDRDPELAHLQERYRADFEAAVAAALTELTARERTVLRMYFVEQMGYAALGRLFQVHPTTVSRWLAVAREHVLAETRRRLRERLGISASEIESLMRILPSQLGLSLERLLPRPE
jgi:RNA polymerase sigma-70 factor (ECF subfamily)